METIEPGHKYRLISLDGEHQQEIRFVRRKYPLGMKQAVYPGTTCQDVLRVVHDRTGFLNAEVVKENHMKAVISGTDSYLIEAFQR